MKKTEGGQGPIKIDLHQLRQWLDKGVTMTECAKRFGCSVAAVSMRAKRIKTDKARYLLDRAAVTRTIDNKFDAIEQLTAINKYALEMLDLLMRWQRGDEEAIQALEQSRKKVKIGTSGEPEWVDEIVLQDPRALALKAMAEIRMQVATAMDIQKTLWQVEDVKIVLQLIVDTVLEFLSPEQQKVLVNRIRAKQSITLELGGKQ